MTLDDLFTNDWVMIREHDIHGMVGRSGIDMAFLA